jgi:hypothetical protein
MLMSAAISVAAAVLTYAIGSRGAALRCELSKLSFRAVRCKSVPLGKARQSTLNHRALPILAM